jgi:hypothetical protein
LFATRRWTGSIWAAPASTLLLVLAARLCAAAENPQQERVAAAAAAAQASCHGQIHHDTYAFERCLLALLEAERKPTVRRLGIEYFGYVGAMSSARLGMLGAEGTAYEFLARFRRTQKRLRIDDLSLCHSVPGDCEVRVARVKLMEAAPEARKRPRRDTSEEHQSVH